jgi:hypothetical protein
MHTNHTSRWIERFALLILLSAWAGSAASAQTATVGDLEPALRSGTTVWITDSRGREERTRIVSVSGDVLTLTAAQGIHTLRAADVKRIRVRHTDALWNGALIGAAAAIAPGLFICRAMEPWENCRAAGPILQLGAFGAGIGIGIDALIRGRRTIYEAPPGSTRLYAAPIVGRHARGLQVTIAF